MQDHRGTEKHTSGGVGPSITKHLERLERCHQPTQPLNTHVKVWGLSFKLHAQESDTHSHLNLLIETAFSPCVVNPVSIILRNRKTGHKRDQQDTKYYDSSQTAANFYYKHSQFVCSCLVCMLRFCVF